MLTLRAALGAYPHTAPLRDGRVISQQLRFDLAEIVPVNRAFRPMVNDLAFDVSEMALVTHMLGRARRRPLRGVPVVLMRQSALELLTCPKESKLASAADLAAKTIGVRAYTQTTGTWVRGILHDQFGLDLSTLKWVTFEPAHVDGFDDPANCSRAADGKTLLEMTLGGEVDAAIGLEPHPSLRPVLANAEDIERDFERQSGVRPINHVLVVKEELAQQQPWLTSELYFVFNAARERSIVEDGADPATYGLAANRGAIELLARYAVEQGIVSRAFGAEELFEAF
jgi:4,5-dihydroxyphthalate decarboxylase